MSDESIDNSNQENSTLDNPQITLGGIYKIPRGFSGTITINTTEPVTIDGADAGYLLDSHIVTTSETADLTIKDLRRG